MIAIIPARGGSKGLPGKNIKLLNEKPLMVYTIEAALQSKLIHRVIVSTDDKKIADIAIASGAEVPFLRPGYLSTDTALAIDNYIYTLDRLNKGTREQISEFIVLQPTSPLRTSSDIDNAIELFKQKNADSVISYTEESHPVFWHKKINKDLSFIDIFKNKLANRQDFEKSYYPNGAVFVFKTDLIKNKKYYSKKSFAYIMPRRRSVDIDTLDDFKFAEFLFSQKINYNNNENEII